jgi:hypothetical protein
MRPKINEANVYDLLYDERIRMACNQAKRIKQDLAKVKRNMFIVKLLEAVSALICVLIISFVFGGWWYGN